MENRYEYIRTRVEYDNNPFRHVIRYQIRECYNVIIADELGEYAEYVEKVVDEFSYTWDEIEKEGIDNINRDFKECYGEDCFK